MEQQQPASGPAWTVDEAAAWFAEQGVPFDADRIKLVIRALRLAPSGSRPSGPEGGRGQAVYPVADLMKIHGALAPWLASREIPG